jgi:hypothetical protein
MIDEDCDDAQSIIKDKHSFLSHNMRRGVASKLNDMIGAAAQSKNS